MSDNTSTNLLLFTNRATIISAVFAVYSYWHFKILKWKYKKKLKGILLTELRWLYYNCINQEILDYDIVRKSNYIYSFNANFYHFPTIDYLISNWNYLDFFKNTHSLFVFSNLNSLLSQIRSFDPKLFRNKPWLDFYFEKRLVDLREHLIDLSYDEDWLDLNIMPQNMKWDKNSIRGIEKYRINYENNKKVDAIIKTYLPNKFFRILNSDEYFWENQ